VPVRRMPEADNCDCLLLRLEGCHISRIIAWSDYLRLRFGGRRL